LFGSVLGGFGGFEVPTIPDRRLGILNPSLRIGLAPKGGALKATALELDDCLVAGFPAVSSSGSYRPHISRYLTA